MELTLVCNVPQLHYSVIYNSALTPLKVLKLTIEKQSVEDVWSWDSPKTLPLGFDIPFGVKPSMHKHSAAPAIPFMSGAKTRGFSARDIHGLRISQGKCKVARVVFLWREEM